MVPWQIVQERIGAEGLMNIADTALRMGVQLVTAYVRGILATSMDVWIAVLNIATGILDTFGDTAINAFTYGAQIVVELARGIVHAHRRLPSWL